MELEWRSDGARAPLLLGLSPEAERTSITTMVKENLTHGPVSTAKKRQQLRRCKKAYSSSWRGKLLLSMWVQPQKARNPLPEKLIKQPLRPDQKPADPKRIPYELRSVVLMASDAAAVRGCDAAVTQLMVQVVVEEFLFETRTAAVNGGVASFLAQDREHSHSMMGRISVVAPPGVLLKTTVRRAEGSDRCPDGRCSTMSDAPDLC